MATREPPDQILKVQIRSREGVNPDLIYTVDFVIHEHGFLKRKGMAVSISTIHAPINGHEPIAYTPPTQSAPPPLPRPTTRRSHAARPFWAPTTSIAGPTHNSDDGKTEKGLTEGRDSDQREVHGTRRTCGSELTAARNSLQLRRTPHAHIL